MGQPGIDLSGDDVHFRVLRFRVLRFRLLDWLCPTEVMSSNEQNLRKSLIRLAHENPKIREKILTVLSVDRTSGVSGVDQATVSLHVSLRELQGALMKVSLVANRSVKYADMVDPATSKIAQGIRDDLDNVLDKISSLLVHIN